MNFDDAVELAVHMMSELFGTDSFESAWQGFGGYCSKQELDFNRVAFAACVAIKENNNVSAS